MNDRQTRDVAFDVMATPDGSVTLTMTVDTELVYRHDECGQTHVGLIRTQGREEMHEQILAFIAALQDVARHTETD